MLPAQISWDKNLNSLQISNEIYKTCITGKEKIIVILTREIYCCQVAQEKIKNTLPSSL
jgi:hypothetical protein